MERRLGLLDMRECLICEWNEKMKV